MAVTSIWRVRGWLGKVVIYIENPDKTDNPGFYEGTQMAAKEAQGLSDVIDYAVRQEKTGKAIAVDEGTPVLRQFVSGINCSPGTAREEMMAVKKHFGKEGGTIAYHGYQSFAPGEATPETAHEIGVKLAETLWGQKYQVLVATHLDKENHLHNHFVVNTVSFLDGVKYHRTKKDYCDMQKESDRLCREYGLSVLENHKGGKARQYGEWRAEQEGRPTWRGIIRAEIDEAIRQSMTERQFFENLKVRGYEVKTGADISVRPPGKERFVRLERNFGEAYSIEGIRRRILLQQRPKRPAPGPEHRPRHVRLKGEFQNTRKITGFRALYFHYCYLLGVFPGQQSRRPRRVSFALREDLIRAQELTDEARLLSRRRIDTMEQLTAYRKEVEAEMTGTEEKRKQLYKKLRTKEVLEDPGRQEEIKAEIAVLSRRLKELRREKRLSEDIAARSVSIMEKLKAARKEERAREKEPRARDSPKDSRVRE